MKKKKKKPANIFNEINGAYNIYIFKILELIIKIRLRRRGCAKWRHRIAEILLDF